MQHIYFLWQTGQDCRQADATECAEYDLISFSLNKPGKMKKAWFEWQHMLLQNLCVLCSINEAFTAVQIAYTIVKHTPVITDAGNNLDGPLSLLPRGHNMYDFLKESETWTSQHTCQSISDKLEPWEVGSLPGCCWYMAFALHDGVLTCICRCSNKLFTFSDFLKCSQARVIISFNQSCQFWCNTARGVEDQGHSLLAFGLDPCSTFPWSSESFNVLQILDREIHTFFAIMQWEMMYCTVEIFYSVL